MSLFTRPLQHAIYALRHFKDITIYKKLWKTLKKEDSSVYDSFINACKMVNPNDPFSIERFVKGTKTENINVSVSSRSSLSEIKEKEKHASKMIPIKYIQYPL